MTFNSGAASRPARGYIGYMGVHALSRFPLNCHSYSVRRGGITIK